MKETEAGVCQERTKNEGEKKGGNDLFVFSLSLSLWKEGRREKKKVKKQESHRNHKGKSGFSGLEKVRLLSSHGNFFLLRFLKQL